MMKRAGFSPSDLVLVSRPHSSRLPARVGDQVTLNSGGPLLLVVDVDGAVATVATSDGQENSIRDVCLTVVRRGGYL